MTLDGARALAQRVMFATMGVVITVTRPLPDNVPVVTTGVWLVPQPDTQPTSLDVHRPTNSKILVVPRTALDSLPRGTVIVAPELAGAIDQTWRVVGHEREEVDAWRAIVVVVEEP